MRTAERLLLFAILCLLPAYAATGSGTDPAGHVHEHGRLSYEVAGDGTGSGVRLADIWEHPFYHEKLLLLSALAVLLSTLGVFIALRRTPLLTLTLAQASGTGIALGLAAGWPTLPASLAFLLLVIVLVARPATRHREGLLAALFVAFAGLAVLLLAKSAAGEHSVGNLLFGSLALLDLSHAWPFLCLGAAVLVVHLVAQRPYLAVLADPLHARLAGLPTGTVDFTFHLLQGLVLVGAIRLAGVFLPLALLVLLPGAALARARSLPRALARAALAALILAPLTVAGAILLDLPITAALSFTPALVYLAATVFQPGRP